MRRLFAAAFVLCLAIPALAQNAAPKLEPLPEPPPPPPGLMDDSALEPQVTIIKRGEDVVQEYRIRGKLYMIKVTPPHGVPYYLVDSKGDGSFTRQEPTDTGLRVPMWVIKQF
ncbi:MAG: DUF2782 domain-containing protein [Betaproteobacteria bacterium]|nr:DUF2782 domain-containing protein [Betaproteobacteria bacterium]